MALADAPGELQAGIKAFWPEAEWEHAASISSLESGWDAFADNNTTDASHACGAPLSFLDGLQTYAEHSVGYFQINVCNYPSWVWQRLWNAYQNCGTAHMLWANAGEKWTPWLESATKLGLV